MKAILKYISSDYNFSQLIIILLQNLNLLGQIWELYKTKAQTKVIKSGKVKGHNYFSSGIHINLHEIVTNICW